MILENITMSLFEEGLKKTKSVIIPFGAIEEHGTHLPLGTDIIHMYEISKKTSELYTVFVAPPVYFGMCRSTAHHPGTISIKGDTLRALVRDIITSLYNQGLRNFVLISGHAGGTHMSSILETADAMMEELPEMKASVLSILDLGLASWDGLVENLKDSHAGEVETSVMMHLRPKHVVGSAPDEYPSFPKNILVRDKRRFWPGGVWGTPSLASREKGEKLFNASAMALAKLVKELEMWEG